MFELDNNAQEQLLALANDFSNSLIQKSMRVAKHRHNRRKHIDASTITTRTETASDGRNGGEVGVVEVEDVSLVLRKTWGISIPGLSSMSDRPVNNKGRRGLAAGRILGSSSTYGGHGVSQLNENGKRSRLDGTGDGTGDGDGAIVGSSGNKRKIDTAGM